MLKKWSKVALCAVKTLMVAAFALMVFAACSNGSDEDEDGKKDLPTTTEVFTVKYDVAGLADVTLKDGSKNTNIRKNQGETITADDLWEVTLKDTYKDKYTFDGWYMDAEYTTPFADFAVTKHTTLYAKFTSGITTVATLPALVGTDPFTTGTYTAGTTSSSEWGIGLGEGKDQGVIGTKFEIDTVKHSVKFLYKHEGEETADALMKYSYDSTKKEIYLALSKLGYEKEGDDDTRYLWTRDEIVSYLQSIVGQIFYEKGEPYVYTQEEFEKKRAEIDKMFEVAVTYGYKKFEDGTITLTLKNPIIEGYDTSVTLIPCVPQLLSAWRLREVDEGDIDITTFYFYDNKTWMMCYGDETRVHNGWAGAYDGDATSGRVICTPYWSDTDDAKVTISGNTLT